MPLSLLRRIAMGGAFAPREAASQSGRPQKTMVYPTEAGGVRYRAAKVSGIEARAPALADFFSPSTQVVQFPSVLQFGLKLEF
jgi:hypothetical protein